MKNTATIKKLERLEIQLRNRYAMCREIEDTIAELIKKEYGRLDVYVSCIEDATMPCVMFEDDGATGITLKAFIEQAKQSDFDIFEIQTVL